MGKLDFWAPSGGGVSPTYLFAFINSDQVAATTETPVPWYVDEQLEFNLGDGEDEITIPESGQYLVEVTLTLETGTSLDLAEVELEKG